MPWADDLYTGPPVSVAIQRFADAEDAKENGGMVALFPRTDDAMQLAVPGGEPPQDLHLTLAYLGDDVGGLSPDGLVRSISQLADSYTVITARVMGHATFNPDGGQDGDQEQCAVYLISDSEQLADLHNSVLDAAQSEVNLPVQHAPWLPHLTAAYSVPADRLAFTGEVLFDRLGVAFAGQTQYFPLMGATVGRYSD